MGRKVKGTLFKRGRTYWCKYSHQGVLYRFSLKTTKANHARHEIDRLMALRLGAIADSSFDEKFGGKPVPVHSESGKMLLTEAWRHYIASSERPDSGPTTLRQYAFQFNAFVEWVKREYPNLRFLAEVNRDIVNAFAAHLRKTVCAGTFNKYIRLLGLVFRILSEDAGIGENPWRKITRLRHEAINKRDFSEEELKAIFDVATGEIRTLFLVGYHTALRLGDVCLMEWAEVNLATGLITRIPLKTRRRNKKPVIIPMNDELLAHLKSMAEQPKGKYVCPKMAATYNRDSGAVTDRLQRFFKDCGIRTQQENTGKGTGKRAVVEVGFHSFRHTWVTSAGDRMDSTSIRAIAGWGSPAMEKTYSHVSMARLKQGIQGQKRVTGLVPQPSTVEGMTDDQVRQMADVIEAEMRRRKDKTSDKNGSVAA